MADELNDLVPYPEFLVQVNEFGQTPPAALEMEVTYPRKKLRIRGVNPVHHADSGVLVHWEAEDPEATVACNASQATGTLKIKMMDPGRVAPGVRVAYELRNFDQSCAGRATASDFVVVSNSVKAYDEDGALIAGIAPTIPAANFR